MKPIRLLEATSAAVLLLVLAAVLGTWLYRRSLDSALARALEDRESAGVLSLVRRGANVHLTRSDGYNVLMLAAYNGDLPLLQEALARGVSPKDASTESWTPLMFAHGPRLRLLVEAGADVNTRDANGRTPLMWHALAIQDAHVLLAHGADLYARNNNGYSALISAEGHRDAIRALSTDPLLWRGDPPGTRHRDRTTRLMFAADRGSVTGLKVELARGTDVNARNEVGWTALTYVIRPGNEACVQLLLDNGAKVNAADIYGRTPLIFAALERSPAVFRLLLSRGADPRLRDGKGRSARTYARTQLALLRLLRQSAQRDPVRNHRKRP